MGNYESETKASICAGIICGRVGHHPAAPPARSGRPPSGNQRGGSGTIEYLQVLAKIRDFPALNQSQEGNF